MWQLAYHVRERDREIDATRAQDRRKEIVPISTAWMRRCALWDNSGWPSNHPLIDMNPPKFRQDIRLAREAVERDPPNFVPAHSLTGACVYCHGGR